MNRVNVKPEMFKWARERSGLDIESLIKNFPKLSDWESDAFSPTLKQLEKFANATHTPFGFFFLPQPPEERIPIADLRSLSGTSYGAPSPNLLDTIYTMQRRQAWLREERIECEAVPLDFLGSARLTDDPEAVGREMRRIIGFSDGWAEEVRTWKEAVSVLRRGIEQLGVMAIINGVVGNNTHRKLDVGEFRGFALYDAYAPLIFVNGADAKSAQMFTLAHELAHVWLGPEGEGVSGFEGIFPGGQKVEKFCDKAAAEFLLPEREMKAHWLQAKKESQPFKALARKFKISPIVAGRRAMDLRLVDKEVFFEFYYTYISQERKRKSGTEGGDFYNNQNTRVGELFATRVIWAAKEGRLSFKEAYSLTGLNGGAFQEYALRLGYDMP
jgi:Zn-dependent peptidase ImmA (M78 family)